MIIPIKQLILEGAVNTGAIQNSKSPVKYKFPLYPNTLKPTGVNSGNQGTINGSHNNPNISPNTASKISPDVAEYNAALFNKVEAVK